MEKNAIFYELNEKDLIRFHFRLLRQNGFFIALLILGCLIIANLIYSYFNPLYTSAITLTGQIIFLIFIFLLIPVYVFFSTKKTYNKEGFNQKLQLKWNDTAVEFSGKDYKKLIHWSRIVKIVENVEYFQFYETRNQAHIVPKRKLKPEEILNLRSFIENHELIIPKLRIR